MLNLYRRVISALDTLLLKLAFNAQTVAIVYMTLALLLAMVAFLLKLHDVSFDGIVENGTDVPSVIGGLGVGVSKQVGYIWAPNWGLTSFILLPLAIHNILSARAAAESIIPSLLARDMLQRRDGQPIEPAKIEEQWRAASAPWSAVVFLWILVVAVFIILGDFIPVVGKWLLSPEFVKEAVAGLEINHSEYEFDWSIAALYPSMNVSASVNYAFSLTAYLFVPVLGAGFMLGCFWWFVSVSSFFSFSKLAANSYVVVPDVKSRDKRRGFEVFEPIFDHLLRAGLVTTIMALAMHFQNVYLRTPGHENIIELLFKNAVVAASSLLSLNFGEAISYVTSMEDVLDMSGKELSLQTYVTAIANLLVFCIVLGLMWRWLRKLAREGRTHLSRHRDLSSKEKQKLRTMVIWPVGWMSAISLTILIGLSILSMYFVNLLPFIVMAVAIYLLTSNQFFGRNALSDDEDEYDGEL